MNTLKDDYQSSRVLSRVLTYYYVENKNQGEIAELLHLSTAKVNRFLKYGRQQGMVEIKIHTPFQHIFELESVLENKTNLRQAIVVPNLIEGYDATIENVGKAAAEYLVAHLRDGDIIALGGGQFVSSAVKSLSADKSFPVKVVPSIGGVQGRHFTDVNNLAAEMARKLGGESYQLHTPAFVDNEEERDILLGTRHVTEVLDIARKAQIIMVGIGTLQAGGASYLHFNKVTNEELNEITNVYLGVGEILSQIFNARGEFCAPLYANRVVGINMTEMMQIPMRIGVAAGQHKVIPITAALRGGFLHTLITDEETAREIVKIY
jgi:DNA-binding transcriptional regulator LsrR (DeoR family)